MGYSSHRFGVFNFPQQAMMSDINYNTIAEEIRKAYQMDKYAHAYYGWDWNLWKRMEAVKTYYIFNATSRSMTTYGPYAVEADATKQAEALAQGTPSQEFVVLKALSKSVAVKPVTTTRF